MVRRRLATLAPCARRVATDARQGLWCARVRPATPCPLAAALCAGGAGKETEGGMGRRGGGGRAGRVLPAASALAKLWKGEQLGPPLSSPAATDCCPINLVRLLVGDSNTSMRLGEHVGSIDGDDISASNPRSRGRFWHASMPGSSQPQPAQAELELWLN